MDQFTLLMAGSIFQTMKQTNQIQPIKDENGVLIGLIVDQLPSEIHTQFGNIEALATATGAGSLDKKMVDLATFKMAAEDFGADEVSIKKIEHNALRIREEEGKTCVVWKDDY